MKPDRRMLLDQTDKARRMMGNQFLTADIRAMAKRAADAGEAALGLQDAAARLQGLPKAGLRASDDPSNRPVSTSGSNIPPGGRK